jgi:hypothetical protein
VTDPPIVTVDPPRPPADRVAPFVAIRSPSRNARVSRRRARLLASVTDAVGVVRTEVWVDGKRRMSSPNGEDLVNWRMRRLRRGRHLVVVRAYDAAGNHGRASVRVRIIR